MNRWGVLVMLVCICFITVWVAVEGYRFGREDSAIEHCHEKGGERVALHGHNICVRISEEIK
jgi:hypothetical protein